MATTDLGTTGFGIAQDENGNGMTAHTLRMILSEHWQTPGVVTGGAATGRTDLRYNVAKGVAVVSRGTADGYAEVAWDAAQTQPVPAGDPSNPRVDAIWVQAHDKDNGDPDNHVVLGVTTGTPSANPSIPALPAGATAIAYRKVPAGATSTQHTEDTASVDYALPHGTSIGVFARLAENKDGAVPNDQKTDLFTTRYTFVTDRNIEMRVFMCISTPDKGKGQSGVATCRFFVDDQLYTSRKISYDENWVTHEFSTEVQVTPGSHKYSMIMFRQQGDPYVAHWGLMPNHDMGDDRYVGRVLRLRDLGIAK